MEKSIYPRPMKAFAIGILCPLVLLMVIAQTTTRVDYITQVKNGPVIVASFLVPLPVTVAALPAGATLVIPAAIWPESATIPISQANITIQCQPGATLQAMASLTFWTVTGTGTTITGCGHNANSQINVIGILCTGCSNITSTYNTFTGNGTLSTGMQDICVGASCQGAGPAVTGVYIAHNRHLNVYQGDIIWNSDAVDVDSEYATGLTGDGIYNNTLLNTFAAGAIFRVHDFTFQNMGRYCMEWAGNGYQWIDFSHTSCLLNSGGIGGISGGTSSSGGSTDQLIGGVIDGNSVSGNGTAGGGNYGNEIYGHDYKVTNNTVSGSLFIHGFVYGGWNILFEHNHVNGVGVASSGMCFIPNNTFFVGIYTIHDNTFHDNYCTNAVSGGIQAGFAGDIIDTFHDFRAPGSHTIDASPGVNYTSVVLGGQTPPYRTVTVTNVDSNIMPVVNGFNLKTPGFFSFAGISSAEAAPIQIRGLKVTNQNSVQFGQAISTNAFANLQASEQGGMYSNLAVINNAGFAPGSIIDYGNNASGIGAGTDSVTSFTSPALGFSTLAVQPFVNGQIVTVAAGTGVIPTGLTAGTGYYVVNSTATSVQLSATFGGGAITFTGGTLPIIVNSVPVTDFTIIPYFPKTTGSGISPTCTSQPAAGGGVGGATCAVNGNQVQGAVNIITTNVGGAPTAGVTNLLTLVFPAGTFASNPGCFAQWAGANYATGPIGGGCSTTLGVTTLFVTYFGSSALTVGSSPLSLYTVSYIIN